MVAVGPPHNASLQYKEKTPALALAAITHLRGPLAAIAPELTTVLSTTEVVVTWRTVSTVDLVFRHVNVLKAIVQTCPTLATASLSIHAWTCLLFAAATRIVRRQVPQRTLVLANKAILLPTERTAFQRAPVIPRSPSAVIILTVRRLV
jgi:hypothetical protein